MPRISWLLISVAFLPITISTATADDCKEQVKTAYLNYEDGKSEFAIKARALRKDTSSENYEAFCEALTSARERMQNYVDTLQACKHLSMDGGASLGNLLPLLKQERDKYASISQTQRCGD